MRKTGLIVALTIALTHVGCVSSDPVGLSPRGLDGRETEHCAIADAWVRNGSSVNTNNGSATSLYADAADSGGAERRMFLRFEVAGSTAPVTRAVLRLRSMRSADHGGEVHLVADDTWEEPRINWANQPAFGGAIDAAEAVGSDSIVELDVTSAVHGDGRYSFAITTPSDDEVRYLSRESGEAPCLVVTSESTIAADSGAPPPSDACSPPLADAGTGSDAGSTTAPDAGGTSDAGGTIDAGTATDAGTYMPPPPSTGGYLLISRSELMSLPTSGAAWSAMLAVADGSLGEPNLANQDNKHAVMTLAVALVYARTGTASYRTKAREAIMSAIGTEVGGRTLALGRSLGAYALAADFIDLGGASAADDARFRSWLAAVRTDYIGNHGRWVDLRQTHEDSSNNWGAFAGASRIAASLYLGDTADVAVAASVLRGFLGDRSAWSRFQGQITDLTGDDRTWACDPSRAGFVPINGACTISGIDLDGAIVRDISRGGALRWPPNDPGISYTLESLQGLILQAELLSRNGYPDAWSWSSQALRRAALLVSRSGASGGDTWNHSSVSYHVPWLLNARYGLGLPTRPAGYGRIFGYTDWLYGS